MDPILQSDVYQLVSDAEKIRRGLGKLAEDCASWTRSQEEDDLIGLFESLRRAEIDLSITLSDFVANPGAFGTDDARLALIDLHEAYGNLNALFNDVKKAAAEFNDAYIHPCEFEHLEVDCRRLEKTVCRVQNDFEDKDNDPDLSQTE